MLPESCEQTGGFGDCGNRPAAAKLEQLEHSELPFPSKASIQTSVSPGSIACGGGHDAGDSASAMYAYPFFHCMSFLVANKLWILSYCWKEI